MTGQWTDNTLGKTPQRIRPETHWFQETRPHHRVSGDPYGRVDGGLWFSLQFKQVVQRSFTGLRGATFGNLINAGARSRADQP